MPVPIPIPAKPNDWLGMELESDPGIPPIGGKRPIGLENGMG